MVMQHFTVRVHVGMGSVILQHTVGVMPVVLIMYMAVVVLEGIVPVPVLMALGNMQPHTDPEPPS